MSHVTHGEESQGFGLNQRASREDWRVGASSVPVPVTDRGEVVAVLVGPDAVPLRKRAKRVLLPEYIKLILEGPLSDDVLEDVDAARGEP